VLEFGLADKRERLRLYQFESISARRAKWESAITLKIRKYFS